MHLSQSRKGAKRIEIKSSFIFSLRLGVFARKQVLCFDLLIQRNHLCYLEYFFSALIKNNFAIASVMKLSTNSTSAR